MLQLEAESALDPRCVWAGVWRVARGIAGLQRCKVAKVRAHKTAYLGEPPDIRLRRLANAKADEFAKLSATWPPRPRPFIREQLNLAWKNALVACCVMAKATLLWPAAAGMVASVQHPTTAAARAERRSQRLAQLQRRRADRVALQRSAAATQMWYTVGSFSHCAVCLCRQGSAVSAQPCGGVRALPDRVGPSSSRAWPPRAGRRFARPHRCTRCCPRPNSPVLQSVLVMVFCRLSDYALWSIEAVPAGRAFS